MDTHVPINSKNLTGSIPIARSSGSTPIVTWGSTASTVAGIADPKSFVTSVSVATLIRVVICFCFGKFMFVENPLAIVNNDANETNVKMGFFVIGFIILLRFFSFFLFTSMGIVGVSLCCFDYFWCWVDRKNENQLSISSIIKSSIHLEAFPPKTSITKL